MKPNDINPNDIYRNAAESTWVRGGADLNPSLVPNKWDLTC